jgi:hypothetical protein
MKNDFLKKLSLVSLFTIMLTGAGCATSLPTTAPVPQNPALKPVTIVPLNADDQKAIKDFVASGSPLVRILPASDWVIPDGIDPAQVEFGSAIQSPEIVFGYVEQPNSSIPLWHASGSSAFGAAGQADWASVNFAGVIFSRDSGKTWREAFSIPIYPFDQTYTAEGFRPFNPVGMFTENNLLWLDIVDDGGAGSGEGVLVRYSSPDGVKWTRTNDCLYFVPESYFELSDPAGPYWAATIRPHNLAKYSASDSLHQACPGYVSQLP